MRYALALIAPFLLALLAVPASAQSTNGGALHVEIDSEINFGTAAHDGRGGGTIEIDPATGIRRVTGALVSVGDTHFTGKARVTGRPFSRVRIELPNSITMRARKGQKTVSALFSAGVPPVVTLDANGQFNFAFAGTFKVSDADDGEFQGRFAITADYE